MQKNHDKICPIGHVLIPRFINMEVQTHRQSLSIRKWRGTNLAVLEPSGSPSGNSKYRMSKRSDSSPDFYSREGSCKRSKAISSICTQARSPASSSGEKREKSGLSMSRTPQMRPSLRMGSTISELEALSQAMCPENAWTSATRWTVPVAAAVPQTPFPQAMRVQATLPWNGPRTSSSVPSSSGEAHGLPLGKCFELLCQQGVVHRAASS